MEDWEEREDKLQYERRKNIREEKLGCWYCVSFGYGAYPGCHTAAWRKGNTCDLFRRDPDKK